MTQNVSMTADTVHEHEDHGNLSVFGFWIYLMTDCIVFGCLFTSFAVLRHQFAGGPTAKDMFELKGVAIETALLLISSLTYGFAMLQAYKNKKGSVLGWLVVTALLGAGFLWYEITEFHHFITHGAAPHVSAFWSSFFTLVGTHGLHVTIGIIWMIILMIQVLGNGLTKKMVTRLTCLSLFWHFLDIVWICVFSFVYLLSVV